MSSISRRSALRRVASTGLAIGAGVSLPAIRTRSAFGATERLTVAAIGCGRQGNFDLRQLLRTTRVDCAAICDVFAPHLGVVRTTNALDASCAQHSDFRRVLDRKDVDAVTIATPDHWHGLIAIAAAQAGKDIYCQTPLTRTITEGRAIVRAIERYGVVLQVGSQHRSATLHRRAIEIVRSGHLGKIERIETHVGRNPSGTNVRDTKPPAGLDWNLYLGPAPKVPFNPMRFKWNFRWCSDYAGGNLTDQGAHLNDLAQWSIGMDASGPVRVSAKGRYPAKGIFDAPLDFSVRHEYRNGVTLTSDDRGNGISFYGDRGELHVGREQIVSKPEEIANVSIDERSAKLPSSENHYLNFLEAVASRRRPIASVETGHRSATLCHLGNIAIRLGRNLRWDPDREEFLDDAGADRLRSRPMREPWQL